MKVLLGPIPISSGPWMLRQGLRAHGIQADVGVWKPHPFGYPHDRVFDTADAIADALLTYDAFVGFFGQWLVRDAIPAWQAAGKRFLAVLNGCDVRSPVLMARQGRQTTVCTYCDELAVCPSDAKRAALEWVFEHADAILADIGVLDVVEPLAAARGIAVTPYPQPLDLTDYPVRAPIPARPRSKDDPWVIVHAPSARSKKGTAFVIHAVEQLGAAGLPVRLHLLTGAAHAQVQAALQTADLVVDQLLIGHYGTFAVEAMARGVPTLAHLHPWYAERMGWDLPADMRVEKDLLAPRLEALLRDPARSAALATAQRAHVETHHDAVRCAAAWLPLLDPAREACSA